MKDIKHLVITVTAITLGLLVAVSSAAGAQSSAKRPDVSRISSGAAMSSKEQQRNTAQREAEKAIDTDATAAIEETEKAVKAITAGKHDQALAAIERATGKINILTARRPAAALIPVSVDVAIVDLAPKDVKAVRDLSVAAKTALSDDDPLLARGLLDQLVSEIHVKTYNLPLATYPSAMQTAARLLDEKKTEEAKQALVTALNTLIITDQVFPLPMLQAQGEIKDAQAKRDSDKPAARKLLASAKDELELAKALGYANRAAEYASLNQSIADLDKQLGGTESTTSAFAALREKMNAFVERISPKASTSHQAKK